MTATTQITLLDVDRGGLDSRDSARVVVAADCDRGLYPVSAQGVIEDLLWGFSDRSYDAAAEATEQIIDAGSPVRCVSSHPEFDSVVYTWGESVDDAVRDVHGVLDTVAPAKVVVPYAPVLGSDVDDIVESFNAISGLEPGEITVIVGDREFIDVPTDTGALYGFARGLRLADRVGLAKQRAAERRDIQRWASIDKQGGRAGLGFGWVDGCLVPGDNYDEVCATLELVQCGEISKNKAAAHLGTSPRTITRCIEERAARYGLR